MVIFQISYLSQKDKRQEKTKSDSILNFVPVPTVLHGTEVIDIEAEAMGYSQDKVTYLVNTYSNMIKSFCMILSADEKEGGYGWKQPPKTREETLQLIKDALSIIWSNFEYDELVLLTTGIEKKVLDCDTSALVLHDILQQFGIDSEFIATYGHALLKVGSDYIETNSGGEGSEVVFYDKETFQKKYHYFHPCSYLALAYSNSGCALDIDGDYEGAISYFNKAIELDPNYPEPYYNRGVAKSRMGNYEDAIVDFTKALELNPNYLVAYYSRGVAKRKIGDYEGAIEDFTKVIELTPLILTSAPLSHVISIFIKAYYARGNAKYEMGDYKGAIEDYTKVIELDPDNFDAYYARGNAKEMIGDTEGAKADFAKGDSLRQKEDKPLTPNGRK